MRSCNLKVKIGIARNEEANYLKSFMDLAFRAALTEKKYIFNILQLAEEYLNTIYFKRKSIF